MSKFSFAKLFFVNFLLGRIDNDVNGSVWAALNIERITNGLHSVKSHKIIMICWRNELF